MYSARIISLYLILFINFFSLHLYFHCSSIYASTHINQKSENIMKSLITLLALTSAQSFALDAFYLPYTKHLAPCYEQCINGEYREDNHVTGITNGKYSAFIMKNSHDKVSVFAGKQWTIDLTSNIRTFATIGGVTGYEDVSKNIMGVSAAGYVGFDFHADSDKWGVVFTAIPTPQGMFNIGFRWSL